MDEPHIESRAERRARKRLERGLGKPTGSRKTFWLGAVIILVIGGSIAWLAGVGQGPKDSAAIARDHANLLKSCVTHTGLGMHTHAKLFVLINGEEQELPNGLGIDNTCLHPIHTHDASGIIHMESPKPTNFTLADVFSVWKKNLSTTSLMDNAVTAETKIAFFVDGQEQTFDPAFVLKDRITYAVMFGKKSDTFTPPPFDFPTNL